MERESWDSYFMRLALMAASRATCKKRKVGAVLVKERSVKGTGYNGAPRGVKSCLEEGCLERDGHCIRSVHAESNLILQTDSLDREGATVYCTDRPCWHCSNLLANSGIKEIVFLRPYARDEEEVIKLMRESGIEFRCFEPQNSKDLQIEEADIFLGEVVDRFKL